MGPIADLDTDQVQAVSAAISAVVTVVLVVVTTVYVVLTRRLARTAAASLELENQTRLGANLLIRFLRNDEFRMTVQGPGGAADLRLTLKVVGIDEEFGGWHQPVVLEPKDQHEFRFPVSFAALPAAAHGRLAKLDGTCLNTSGFREPVVSYFFKIDLSKAGNGGQALFHRPELPVRDLEAAGE